MAGIADNIGAERGTDGSLRIARAALQGYDAESLRVLWPSIAARGDIVMDRRGTHRLAEFTMKGVTGGSIQLSGGVEVLMFRDHLLLRGDARLAYRDTVLAAIKADDLAVVSTPVDLLGVLFWLLSPGAEFVTGTVVAVDGGFSAFSGV